MRALSILIVCLAVAVAATAGAKSAKPAKRKARPPAASGDAGSLYLYSLQEKPGPWPKVVSYFVVDPHGPAPTPVGRAELVTVMKGTKLSVLEDGKATAMVAPNTLRDFVRYKADRTPSTAVVIIAVAGFEIDGVTLTKTDVARSVTDAEKRAAAKWYADWKKDFKKLSGEEYNEEQDEMFGRPETLVDAKLIASITFASSEQLVQVSRWNSRDAAQLGYVWFVIDVSLNDRVLTTVKLGIATGPLG